MVSFVKFFIGATLLICWPFSILAQPGPDIKVPRLNRTEDSSETNKARLTSFDIALGASQYPILELPMSEAGAMRIDGSGEKTDLKTNRGAILNLALSRKFPTTWANYSLGLAYLRAGSMPGRGIPSPSTYVRMCAEFEAQFDLNTVWWGFFVTPGIEARRSAYRNVESGHYVDAILLRLAVEKSLSDNWNSLLSFGGAPIARVGLIQSPYSGGSGALADTKASMTESKGTITWSPTPRSSFLIAAAQETVQLNLGSTEGYRKFGLPVAPLEESFSTSSFKLVTRYFMIGSTTRF